VNFLSNQHTHSRLCASVAFSLILASGCSESPAIAPSGPTSGTQGVVGTPAAGTRSGATAGTSAAAGTVGPSSTAGTTGAAGSRTNTSAGTTAAATSGSGATPSVAGSTAVAGSAEPPTAGDTGTAGTAGTAAGTTASAGTGAPVAGTGAEPGKLPHVEKVEGAGLEDAVRGTFGPAVKVKTTPPGGWLIYPQDIGRDGIKHPIFIFGPGGGTNPQYYDMNGEHWDHYTSYGFVVYVAPMSSFNSSASLDDGLTWVIAQNSEASSPLYQKLDTTKVGAAGHSQGSVMVFNFMPDERVTTTIHISGGSFDGGGPAKLKGPTMFLCGPMSDVAYAQCQSDFEVTKVPTFYTNILESSHTTSGRYGWGAIVAWLLWHLAGHEEWKKEFLEPDGQFQTGRYTSKLKNW